MAARAICLDLTRLLSRAGLGPLTGVDRVERAYADWALEIDPGALFLFRSSRGYLLLGASGAREFLSRLDADGPWPRPDLISRLTGKGDLTRHGAEVLLRKHAIDRCLPRGLSVMLARNARPNMVYLNSGHSNLSRRTLSAAAEQAQVAVLIHDLIPLTHPEYCREDRIEPFRQRMSHTAEFADLVICNSQSTADSLAAFGIETPSVTAHLGLAPLPEPQELPFALDPSTPRFICLGTIEPRKNHALLLDLWHTLPEPRPHLHIVGRRGWCSPDFFARLDAHALMGKAIFEHENLSDGQLTTLLTGARALLFPTLAEGYGYPPLEAQRLSVLPICSDLQVLREVTGECAVYLDPQDAYSWLETIKKHSGDSLPMANRPETDLPSWQVHFVRVTEALWPEG